MNTGVLPTPIVNIFYNNVLPSVFSFSPNRNVPQMVRSFSSPKLVNTRRNSLVVYNKKGDVSKFKSFSTTSLLTEQYMEKKSEYQSTRKSTESPERSYLQSSIFPTVNIRQWGMSLVNLLFRHSYVLCIGGGITGSAMLSGDSKQLAITSSKSIAQMASFFNRKSLLGIGSVVVGITALFNYLNPLYIPSTRFAFNPNDFHLDWENVNMVTKDWENIHGWFIRDKNSIRIPTILFFHGRDGNISHQLDNVIALQKKFPCNIFLVSYRGYGMSEGSPSEKKLIFDAQAALNHLLNRVDIDKSKIIVFGRCLGGAVAISLTKNNSSRISALILENTFPSTEDLLSLQVSQRLSKGLRYMLFKDAWLNHTNIQELSVPILFISGSADRVHPPSFMEKLYQCAEKATAKKLVSIPKGDHHDTWMQNTYMDHLSLFLQETLQQPVENTSAVN